MLRQKLSELYSKFLEGSPTDWSDQNNAFNLKYEEEKQIVCERKIAIYGLIFSFLGFAAKIFTSYGTTIEKIILEQRLVTYKVLSEDGNEMLMYTWKTAARYSHIWLPVLCGLLSSYFTWIMVYLDSNIPGVQPPSPLSPKKYKVMSGHTFHLNYVFALTVGFLVSSYMYLNGVSVQY